MKAKNGTFQHKITDKSLIFTGQARPCPVCCTGFGQDRDLLETEVNGQKFFVCETAKASGGEKDCGFVVPVGLSKREIRRLAEQRKRHLLSCGAGGMIGGAL